MGYTTDISAPVPNNTVYELFRLTQIDFSYSEISNGESLHSNRGYEIGIVYMDEFNRATTALASENNTLYIPCINSVNKNYMRLYILRYILKSQGQTTRTLN